MNIFGTLLVVLMKGSIRLSCGGTSYKKFGNHCPIVPNHIALQCVVACILEDLNLLVFNV